MQNELDADHPELEIQILGVNGAGYEAGNETITLGRDLPWLQDVDGQSNAWTSWDVAYRDVAIADASQVEVSSPVESSRHVLESIPPSRLPADRTSRLERAARGPSGQDRRARAGRGAGGLGPGL